MKKVFCFAVLLAYGALAPSWSIADSPKPKKVPRKLDPTFMPITDNPAFPRVLLIGDSISIGYTLEVRKLLDGVANVHRIPANGGPTTNGLAHLDQWLGAGHWDVIHFNWGLHDLKYVNDKLERVAPAEGHHQVSPEDYEKNLRQLVGRLKQTGAKLIWCSSTPVPQCPDGYVNGDEKQYNEIAARVMAAEQVPINELCEFVRPRLATAQRPANVHFTPEGYATLAEQVAKSIRVALESKSASE